jgi:Myb-like DNA-binding domain
MKAPEGRKKKRRKRRSSSASKATFETAKDRLESQSVGEGRGTPTLPRHALEAAQTNGVRGTPSSASRNPKLAEIEAKKRRLLAVVSAAAGDIDGPYSDAETNMCGRDESDHVEQDGGDETNQGSQTHIFGRPAKKSNKSRLTAKWALAGEANSRLTPEATQGTEESFVSKKVKNKKSKSRLVSAPLAADEGEDEPATGLQLPTPNASSQVQRRQPLEDPFTTHNIKDSQIPKKRSSIVGSKGSAAGQKQLKDSLEMPHTDEDTSNEDLTGASSRSREPQSVQNTYSSHHSVSPPNTQTNVASIRRQSFDQNMDFIDPALRDIGMNSNQQPRQIGIYRDVATSQTTGTRKRRLPVDEDDFELTSDSEPKTKKPRKQLLKPKTSNTSGRKSIIRLFREESPDLDAPSTKIKGRRSTQKKAKKHEPTAKGKFSKDELDIIENKILKYREMNDITAFDLNQILQDTPRKLASLWDEMCEALPDRPRQAIVKVCRRKFHNFGVRGKWTKEEDQELKEVYQRFPKRWKQIGQILNRHHEDVRDRWRNYLVCGDNMKRESWTEEEENNLRAVVGEQIQAIRELKAAKIAENPDITHDPRPDIELIDWQLVSEKFGRTRSRLQCLEKWNRLTKLEDSEGDSKELELGPTSWRVKNAIRDVKHMRREDYLELLIALRNSHAGREGKVNWGKLGDLDLRVKWTCMARKVAWKKLRASVPGNEQMKFQDIVTLLLNNLPENDAELEGAGGVVEAVPWSTFEADAPSPQRRSLSDAISSAGEEENENIDPNLNKLNEGDFDSEGIQERHSSLSGSHQSHNLNKNMLREVVGEAYFDRGDTDGGDEDGDVAMADHESVDLDRPSQQKGARSSVSRLRSPISFIVAPNQKQPEYIDTSTHSDEESVDMDIPARRPIGRSRPESVDLDMD